jgi:hypothetical protein
MHHDIKYMQFLFNDFDRISRKISSISSAVLLLKVRDFRQKELIIELAHLRDEKISILHELELYAHEIWVNDMPLDFKLI